MGIVKAIPCARDSIVIVEWADGTFSTFDLLLRIWQDMQHPAHADRGTPEMRTWSPIESLPGELARHWLSEGGTPVKPPRTPDEVRLLAKRELELMGCTLSVFQYAQARSGVHE